MKVAVVAPIGAGITADPVWMSEFARHLEACGFESIVMAEHTVLVTRYTSVYPYDPSGRVDVAPGCPVPDPLEMLAFLAGRTTTLGLATGVLVLPNHHPVMLAKRAATVDVISGGRLRLCVGVGWLREEIEACGAGFDSRGRRADEQIAVLRALSSPHVVRLFDRERAAFNAKPVHEGIETAGTVGRLPGLLRHYTYETMEQYVEKLNRYTTLAAAEMHAAGRRTSLVQAVVRAEATFWRMYVLQGGLLDGWHGAVLCWSSGFYVLAKYVKLWRLGRP